MGGRGTQSSNLKLSYKFFAIVKAKISRVSEVEKKKQQEERFVLPSTGNHLAVWITWSSTSDKHDILEWSVCFSWNNISSLFSNFELWLDLCWYWTSRIWRKIQISDLLEPCMLCLIFSPIIFVGILSQPGDIIWHCHCFLRSKNYWLNYYT